MSDSHVGVDKGGDKDSLPLEDLLLRVYSLTPDEVFYAFGPSSCL